MIELNTNVVEAAAATLGKSDKLDQGIENGVDRLAERYQGQKKKNLTSRTYRIGPTLSKRTRRPLWNQSKDLLNGQAIKKNGRFERVVTTIGPASDPITDYPDGYEQKLATLPVSKRDGKNRRNAAGPDAEKTITPQAQQLFDAEVQSSLDS